MENKVMEVLNSGEPMKAGDIATAAGMDKNDVAKVIKQLVKEEKVYSPKRCFYQKK